MTYLSLAPSEKEIPFVSCCDDKGNELSGNALASGDRYLNSSITLLELKSSKERPDILLAEPSMTPIVSGGLFERFKNERIEPGQFIPINGSNFLGYYAIIISRVFDLIDDSESIGYNVGEARIYTKVVLKKEDTTADFFRIKGFQSFPFISKKVEIIMREYDIRGIGFSNI